MVRSIVTRIVPLMLMTMLSAQLFPVWWSGDGADAQFESEDMKVFFRPGSSLPLLPNTRGVTLHVGAGQTYSTIQAAENDASNGDVIVVHSGTYAENVHVDVEVTVQAQTAVVLDGNYGNGFTVDAQNVTITGFYITNCDVGIFSHVMGLNATYNVFNNNGNDILFSIEEVRDDDYHGYPITIENNVMQGTSSSTSVGFFGVISYSGGAGDVIMGDISFAYNRISCISDTCGFRYNLYIEWIVTGSVRLGEVNVHDNIQERGGGFISISTYFGSFKDVQVTVGTKKVVDNELRNFTGDGIVISLFNGLNWTGSTTGMIGGALIQRNMFKNGMDSSQGIRMDYGSAQLFKDQASVSIERSMIEENTIEVLGIGIGVSSSTSLGEVIQDMTSISIGDILVDKNNIKRGAIGINLIYQGFNGMSGTATGSIGDTYVTDNILNITGDCLVVEMYSLGMGLSDEASFAMGDVICDNNDIVSLTSPCSGVLFRIDYVGSYLSDNSSFALGPIEATHNTIWATWGVLFDDLYYLGSYLQNDSTFEMGGILISSNQVNASGGIIVDQMEVICSRNSDRTRSWMDDVRITDNDILDIGNIDSLLALPSRAAQSTGIEIATYTSVGSTNTGSSFVHVGNLTVLDNVIERKGTGILMHGLQDMGSQLSLNARGEIGAFRIERNDISRSVSGIRVDTLERMGYSNFDSSIFEMAGLTISSNRISSDDTSVTISTIRIVGCYLYDNAQFILGRIAIEGNNITSLYSAGMVLSNLYEIGSYSIGGNCSFEGISISKNAFETQSASIWINTVQYMGYYLEGDAVFNMGDFDIEGNVIHSSVGKGIYFSSFSDVGSRLIEQARSSLGFLSIAGNRIRSDYSGGIDIARMSSICSSNTAFTVSTMGGLTVSGNDIITMMLPIKVTSLTDVCTYLSNNASSYFGGILISNNTVRSNESGIVLGGTQYVAAYVQNDAVATIGDISVSGNDVTAGTVGIEVPNHSGWAFFDSDNGISRFGGLRIDDNTIESKDEGILFEGTSMGYAMGGNTECRVGAISMSGNELSSGNGSHVTMEAGTTWAFSSFIIDSFHVKENIVHGSMKDGISIDIYLMAAGESHLEVLEWSVSGNTMHDVAIRALNISATISRDQTASIAVPELEVRLNDLTRAGIGLEMNGPQNARAYLNNFIGNDVDLKVMRSDVKWISGSPIWYRHKMANISGYVGNYWDRYTGTDTDDDGIGETPYDTSYGLDLYPFTSNIDDHYPPWNDVTPPDISFTFPLDGSFTNLTDIIATWAGTDDLLGIGHYSVRLDTGGWADVGLRTYQVFTSLSEGRHTITLRAVDLAGNAREISSHFTVDVVTPFVEIVIPEEGSGIPVNDVTLEWTGTDDLAGMSNYRLNMDGGPWIDAGLVLTYVFGTVADGPHQVTLRGYDRAGNYQDDVVSFTVDTDLPDITMAMPLDGGYYNMTDITVSWTIEDITVVSTSVRLDDGDPTDVSGTSSLLMTGLTEGGHILWVHTVDLAGNEVTLPVHFVIDLTAPEMAASYPIEGGYINRTDVDISLSVNGTGSPIELVFYRLDDGNLWELTDPDLVGDSLTLPIRGLTEAAHKMYFRVSDAAGNWNDLTFDFTVDLTPPAIIMRWPMGTFIPIDTLVRVTFSENISLDSSYVNLDDLAGNYSGSGPELIFDCFSDLEVGKTYNITVSATDLAGNRIGSTWEFTTADRGFIIGRIVFRNGGGVDNAEVRLDSGDKVRTDDEGWFEIIAPPGNRTAKVYLEGEEVGGFTAYVEVGKETDVGDVEVDGPSSFPWWIVIVIIGSASVTGGILAFVVVRKKGDSADNWQEEQEE